MTFFLEHSAGKDILMKVLHRRSRKVLNIWGGGGGGGGGKVQNIGGGGGDNEGVTQA